MELKPFAQYRRSQIAELRPWEPGERMLQGVSISKEDLKAGSPKLGDMIARNPKNHADQWLVAAQYFADNFEPIDRPEPAAQADCEPVAWRWRFKEEHSWAMRTTKPPFASDADVMCEPLYIAPPAPVNAELAGEFKPCVIEFGPITEIVLEDVSSVSRPVFPEHPHMVNWLCAMDDDRVVGVRIWQTLPARSNSPPAPAADKVKEIAEALAHSGTLQSVCSDGNSDVRYAAKDIAREIASLLLAAPPPPAQEGGGHLPTYGKLSWGELGRDVSEATCGTRSDYAFDPRYYPGHQCPKINFNSLSRIVDKYRLASPGSSPAPPEPVNEQTVAELIRTLEQIVEEKCDYMRINNLGDPETQHTVKQARAALSAARGAKADGGGR